MFTRTEKVTTSAHDDMDLGDEPCPPHAFDQGWGWLRARTSTPTPCPSCSAGAAARSD